ncbi:MAG: SPOR domain-containing protein, partial [Deltaproteobacteria bacterium]|nr:SPOR domain-containing protein [Deltaproteobacteria bacterium]
MAKSRSRRKKSQPSMGALRVVKILAGTGAVIALLFLVGFAVDMFSRKRSVSEERPADFSILLGEVAAPMVQTARAHQQPPNDSFSFFDTLLEKAQNKKAGALDERRKKSILAIQKKRKKKAPAGSASVSDAAARQTSSVVYKIQLGSFQSMEGARNFCADLKAKGYVPYTSKVDVPGKGTVWRVRIGRFRDIESAQESAGEF